MDVLNTDDHLSPHPQGLVAFGIIPADAKDSLGETIGGWDLPYLTYIRRYLLTDQGGTST